MPWIRLSVPLLACLLAVSVTAQNQPESSERPAFVETVDVLQAKIAALADDAEANAGDTETLAALAKARQWLTQANDSLAFTIEVRSEAENAPALLSSIREQLSSGSVIQVPDPSAAVTLQEAERTLTELSARLDAARSELNTLQAETGRRQDRRTEIPGLIAQSQQRLDELRRQLEADPGSESGQSRAAQMLREAEWHATTASVTALEAELTSYQSRQDLLPARRDLALKQVAELESATTAWQSAVNTLRQRDARSTARIAEQMLTQAGLQHAVLEAFATEIRQLAEERATTDGIPQRIARIDATISEYRTELATLRDEYAAAQRRLDATGLNRATGLLLRRQAGILPDMSSLEREQRRLHRDLENAELSLIERQEARVGAGDIDTVVDTIMREIRQDSPDVSDADIESLRPTAVSLASSRRDLLDQLVSDDTRYFQSLFELSDITDTLLTATRAYQTFIDERVLWIRSIGVNRFPSYADAVATAQLVLRPAEWRQAMRESFGRGLSTLPAPAAGLVLLVLLFVTRTRSLTEIRRTGELVSSYRTDRYHHTVLALVCTVLAALPVPAALWWFGWLLTRPVDQVTLGFAAGEALRNLAVIYFPIAVLRVMLRSAGLAEQHFRWSKSATASARNNLNWSVPVSMSGIGFAIFLQGLDDEVASRTLGRAAFTLSLLALCGLIIRVLRPNGSVWKEILRRSPSAWLTRLRGPLYAIMLALPIAIIVLAWLGYYESALQFADRIERSVAIVLVILILNSMLRRWLFIVRRVVAVEDAKRRKEQEAEGAQSQTANAPTESSIAPIDEDKVDLPAISMQTQQLFRTVTAIALAIGLYATWANVLPALRMLDRIHIWPEIRFVASENNDTIPVLSGQVSLATDSPAQANISTDSSPAASSDSVSLMPTGLPGLGDTSQTPSDDASKREMTPVTLADLGLAVVVLVATVIAFRNLPGLIEIIVLQRLPLDAGSRYALSTVIRYAIAITGILTASNAAGLSWNEVQWLAAALTFGLAFGLQEIFANFVSGLIILAERPIRLGDTVTVGSVTGSVTRIRMRATTITDWDRKELVIPNKTFVTGDVINWTLSDPILRITIPVGVSYSSDIERVECELLTIASGHHVVLQDPKPYVVFTRFGDSTLDFELRVFIPSIDHLVTIRHDMHMRITRAFRSAGIEIAFPQRDLHIRSVTPIPIERAGQAGSDIGIIDQPSDGSERG